MLIVWVVAFVVGVALLVQGANLFLRAAESIGRAIGLSSFIIGVLIVGMGTSLPELVSSLLAVFQGIPELVPASVIGSNISNILLIVGLTSVIGGVIRVNKDLVNLDIPLLITATALTGVVVLDGQLERWEAVMLLASFIVYLIYTIKHTDEGDIQEELHSIESPARMHWKDVAFFVAGLLGLVGGAQLMVTAVISISNLTGFAVGLISLVAVALGTSLPELTVSVTSALKGKTDVALGNIFGSNVFNILFVLGIPGLFSVLPLDQQTLMIGLPAMIIATLLLTFSSMSRKIHSYEGAMYLVLYVVFLVYLWQGAFIS